MRRRAVSIQAAGVVAVSLLTALVPSASARAITNAHARIPTSKAPYVVSIFVNPAPGVYAPELTCTGTLIGARFVLTAAHCLTGLTAEQLFVGAGGSSLTDTFLYGAAAIAVHPGYREPSTLDDGLLDDLALIRLVEPVAGAASLALAPAKDRALLRNRKGLALYGWGADENGEVNQQMGFAKQRDVTASATRWFTGFDPRKQIAAGPRRSDASRAGPCVGDSGGPLIGYSAKGRPAIVGVVSYGAAGCTGGVPAVYTRVSAYRRWISAARAELTARAPETVLTYQVADVNADGTGPSALAADIDSVLVTVDERTVTFVVVLATLDPTLGYRTSIDVTAPGSLVPVARITEQGLVAPDGSLRCVVTLRVGDEPGLGPIRSYQVPSSCLVPLSGVTFDAHLHSEALAADASVVGRDSALVEAVNLLVP